MIDKDVQRALREKYSPEGSTLRQLQERLLEMLLYIDRVCRREKIEWWIGSGTLLGAIRHGGFIPWDDDIDVEMRPESLHRFIRAVEADPENRYVVQTHSTDPGYIFPFAKLRDTHSHVDEENPSWMPMRYDGCSIDLFTMAPSSSLKLHKAGRKCIAAQINLWRLLPRLPAPLRRPVAAMADVAIRGCALPLLRGLSTIGAGSRLRHSAGAPFHRERRAGELFPLSEVEFEGHRFPAPGNPDAYLRRIYGDYTAIPPADKIHTHAMSIQLF